MSGKGSKRRPDPRGNFHANYDRVFGGTEVVEVCAFCDTPITTLPPGIAFCDVCDTCVEGNTKEIVR